MPTLSLLCGDLIDYGLPEEDLLFAQEITACVKHPILGNHEFESGKQDEVRRIHGGHSTHSLSSAVGVLPLLR